MSTHAHTHPPDADRRLLLAMAFWLGFGLGATFQSCVANLPPHPLGPPAASERR